MIRDTTVISPVRLIQQSVWALAVFMAPLQSALADERCSVDNQLVDGSAAVVMANRSGVVRCVRIDDGKPSREFEYDAGQLVRRREWNDLGQRLEMHFFPNGALRSRLREVVFEGRPAWDREDFWDSGLLRLRGTFLADGRQQGLVQTYHANGPLAAEAWYDQGRLIRRKAFEPDGRLQLEEEFHADGRLKSTMQRF